MTHDANTTLHLAESLAEVPYSVSYPCVVEIEGRPETVMIPETDHCCRGFDKVIPLLGAEGLEGVGPIGAPEAGGLGRLMNSKDVVDVALKALAKDPLFFLCSPHSACDDCDRARRSIPC